MKAKKTDARNEHPLIASDIQLFSAVFTDHVCAFLQVFLDVTLPEPQNEPAHISQFVIDFLVPLNIPLQLLLPVFLIGTNLFSRMFLIMGPLSRPRSKILRVAVSRIILSSEASKVKLVGNLVA
jgi:hypothetical protein